MDTVQQTKYRILLVGDACLDIYWFGVVDRISPEAPVPVFQYKYTEQHTGMAGNVSLNLETLGCEVVQICKDTGTKTRLIDLRSKQQITRIDNETAVTPITFADLGVIDYDAVVVSDYNKGSVSYELIEQIIQTGLPVFVDTKKTDLKRFEGAWVKINELEYSKITSECKGLIVTRGARGASVIHHSIECPAPEVEVADVTGAGDTFLAAFAYQYLGTTNLVQSVRFAIDASAVTVQHLGCYAPMLGEIE
jgi:D-beta-D-heptose 7-phosphate kinase/D-beta-D-heptose 1-phosphate adenosyltransferase